MKENTNINHVPFTIGILPAITSSDVDLANHKQLRLALLCKTPEQRHWQKVLEMGIKAIALFLFMPAKYLFDGRDDITAFPVNVREVGKIFRP
ncbi:MAG: hypothetical protein R2788_22600 [Saprospiraceae bacterium]